MKVAIGMPIYRHVEPRTMVALLKTLSTLQARHYWYCVLTYAGESVVAAARNMVAHQFLASDASHLFWIDADIDWEPEEFFKVLDLAGQHQIIGAAYTTKTEPKRFMIEAERLDVDGEGLLTVRGMGLGFTCVDREVIQTLADKAVVVGINASKVKRIFHGADDLGEDKNFFRDAITAGYQVKLRPDVTLGHVGTAVYRGNLAETLKG
jgi:hypothetical protein